MKHNKSSEDYLEAILLLSRELKNVHQIDVARKMGVSQPAVLKALKLLKSNGYLDTDGLHIYLTRTGTEIAEQVYHRHCVIRQLLIALGVNEEDANADACEIEHCVSPATFSAMENFVKNDK